MSNIFLQQWVIWHHTLSNRNLWGSGEPVFFYRTSSLQHPFGEQPPWSSVLSWRASVRAGESWHLSSKPSSVFPLN